MQQKFMQDTDTYRYTVNIRRFLVIGATLL